MEKQNEKIKLLIDQSGKIFLLTFFLDIIARIFWEAYILFSDSTFKWYILGMMKPPGPIAAGITLVKVGLL